MITIYIKTHLANVPGFEFRQKSPNRWMYSVSKSLVILVLTMSTTAFSDTLRLDGHSLTVELASTPEERHRGLMHRESLDDNEGMLFVYPDSQPRRFWMKNTFIPLSVGLFDAERRLVEILHLDPPTPAMQFRPPITVSANPARFALEVRQDWFADHGITTGAMFELLSD